MILRVDKGSMWRSRDVACVQGWHPSCFIFSSIEKDKPPYLLHTQGHINPYFSNKVQCLFYNLPLLIEILQFSCCLFNIIKLQKKQYFESVYVFLYLLMRWIMFEKNGLPYSQFKFFGPNT